MRYFGALSTLLLCLLCTLGTTSGAKLLFTREHAQGTDIATLELSFTGEQVIHTVTQNSKTASITGAGGLVFATDDIIDAGPTVLYSVDVSGGPLQTFRDESSTGLFPAGVDPEVELVSVDTATGRVHWLLEGEDDSTGTITAAYFRSARLDGSDVQSVLIDLSSYPGLPSQRIESFAVFQGVYYFTVKDDRFVFKMDGSSVSFFYYISPDADDAVSGVASSAVSFDPVSGMLCYMLNAPSAARVGKDIQYVGCLRPDGTGLVSIRPLHWDRNTFRSEAFTAVNSFLFFGAGTNQISRTRFPTSVGTILPLTILFSSPFGTTIKSTGLLFEGAIPPPPPNPPPTSGGDGNCDGECSTDNTYSCTSNGNFAVSASSAGSSVRICFDDSNCPV